MNTRKDPPKLAYTIPEVAKMIGLSAQQIRRMVKRDEIAAKLLGGRILIPSDVAHALLEDAPSAAAQ